MNALINEYLYAFYIVFNSLFILQIKYIMYWCHVIWYGIAFSIYNFSLHYRILHSYLNYKIKTNANRLRNSLKSTTVLGFFGAGQLARMSAVQAFRFGIQIATYSDRPKNEPVQFISPFSSSGSFEDVDAMVDFAKSCDIITLENETTTTSIPSPILTPKLKHNFLSTTSSY